MKKVKAIKEKCEKLEADFNKSKREIEEQIAKATELKNRSEAQKKQATTTEELKSINSAIEEANYIITAANNKLNVITIAREEAAARLLPEAHAIFKEIREKEKPFINDRLMDLINHLEEIEEDLEILRSVERYSLRISKNNAAVTGCINMSAIPAGELPSIKGGEEFKPLWMKAFIDMWRSQKEKSRVVNSCLNAKYEGEVFKY